MASNENILVIGACGQVGSELTLKLCELHGKENVVAADIAPPRRDLFPARFEIMDATDKNRLHMLLAKYDITQVYLLAAIMSAKGEQMPQVAWDLNMNSLRLVLEAARESKQIKKVFWPSTIAVFGANTPAYETPQHTIMEPTTIYGVSKLAGELLCQYYFTKYGVDVRSVRYPGLISYKTLPGGGTTDYAVHIFYEALQKQSYECFLRPDTQMPMMYMPDAIRATVELMEAPAEKIKVRTAYNVTAMSFTPQQIADEIKKQMPEFSITYKPDYRQQIADSWPKSINDSDARNDWGWKHSFDLKAMVNDILINLKKKLKEPADMQ